MFSAIPAPLPSRIAARLCVFRLYHLDVDTGGDGVTRLFKVKKGKTLGSSDIKRLLDHKATLLYSRLLTHFPRARIAFLVIRGAYGMMPYQEPPFSLRQQPCHALGSDLPMAGTGPAPGANSRSLFQDHLPHRRLHPWSKREGGRLNRCLHSHLVKNYLCIPPLPFLLLLLYHPCPFCGLLGRHCHLHIQPLHHEPGKDAISRQPKNTDIAQPSPETDKETERGQASPGQSTE